MFIKTIIDIIATDISGILIGGGHWNFQPQPILDSTTLTKKINPETLHVRKMLKECDMVNIWREFHPLEKQFTFFCHFCSHLTHCVI